MNNPIRIVVADDHPALRAGLSAILGTTPDLRVVGEAEDGDAVWRLCEQLQPAVLLLDLRMAGPPPAATLDHLAAICPELKVLIYSAFVDRVWVARLTAPRPAGYVLKEEPPARLIEAIRTVQAGGRWVSQRVLMELLAFQTEQAALTSEVALTPRQREVLELLVEGRTNDQIAATLRVSKWTVPYHLTRIYAKLGVKRRSEAIAWVARRQRPPDQDEVT